MTKNLTSLVFSGLVDIASQLHKQIFIIMVCFIKTFYFGVVQEFLMFKKSEWPFRARSRH